MLVIRKIKQIVSTALRSYREKQGLSQEEAAFRCGVSVRTFGNLEREGNFEIDTLQKVVDGLGLTQEDFLLTDLSDEKAEA